MTLKQSLEELRNKLDGRFERRSPITYAVVTDVARDSGNNIIGVRATIDNVQDQDVKVPYGVPLNKGAQIEVRLVRGELVQPTYEMTRIIKNDLVVQVDSDYGDIPSPALLTAQWVTDIDSKTAGGPRSGMKAFVTVKFRALNYIYWKVAEYVIQCKPSSKAEWEFTASLPAAQYLENQTAAHSFQGLEIGTAYDFRIAAKGLSPDKISSWTTATFTTAGDNVAPAAPTGTTAVSITDAISLDWSDNSENDFDHYKVYYSIANSGWTRYADNPSVHTSFQTTKTSNLVFSVEGQSSTTDWYFRITAVDKSGNESLFSTVAGPYRSKEGVELGPKPTITSNANDITLTWTPYSVNGAQFGRVDMSFPQATYATSSVSYVIRRQVSTSSSSNNASSQPWTHTVITNPEVDSGRVSHTLRNLTPARYYNFQFQAVDGLGQESVWSPTKSLTSAQTYVDLTPPADVTGLTCVGEDSGAFPGADLELLWTPNTEPDIAYYEVEIHDLSLVGGATSPVAGTLVHAYTVNNPSFTYTHAMNRSHFGTNGKATVTVRVFAYDTAGNRSTGTGAGCWKTFTNNAPAAISIDTPTVFFRNILFHWEPSTAPDFDHYLVTLYQNTQASSSGQTALSNFDGITITDNFLHFAGDAGYFYNLHVTVVDAFGQTSFAAESGWVEVTQSRIITPEDLAGRAYQITVTASNGLTTPGGAALTAGDLAKLYDYDFATGAVKSPNTTWRYVEYEFPVQHVFNKTQIAWTGGSLKFYVAYSTDGTNWTYLAGPLTNGGLTGVADATAAQTAAVTDAATSGNKHYRWPSMAQAKWIRLYVGSATTLTELKQDTYLVADTIDAGDINLAKNIKLFNDASQSGFLIDKDGATFWNGKLAIYSQPSGSTNSRIEIVGDSIRAYNGANKMVEILGSDASNPGSIWAKSGGFGGTGLADATIQLDGTDGSVRIAGTVTVGTAGGTRIEITGGSTGSIKGYNSLNTLQAYFDTDGAIKAGGGNVRLDADGVHILTSNLFESSRSLHLDGSVADGHIYQIDGADASTLYIKNGNFYITVQTDNAMGNHMMTTNVPKIYMSDVDGYIGKHNAYGSGYIAFYKKGFDYALMTDGTNTYINNTNGNIYFRRNNANISYIASDGIHLPQGKWLRIDGNDGIYWGAWGGGWQMFDSNYIRSYLDKTIYTGGGVWGNSWVQSGDMRAHRTPYGNQRHIESGRVNVGTVNAGAGSTDVTVNFIDPFVATPSGACGVTECSGQDDRNFTSRIRCSASQIILGCVNKNSGQATNVVIGWIVEGAD